MIAVLIITEIQKCEYVELICWVCGVVCRKNSQYTYQFKQLNT